MDKRSKQARAIVLEATINALGKRFRPGEQVLLEGKTYAVEELQQLFAEELEAMREVLHATIARATAVKKERGLRRRNKPVLMAVGNLVRALWGQNAAVLGDFELQARKAGEKSVEVKLAAAEKAKRTRKLRGTMGSRQRKKAPKGY